MSGAMRRSDVASPRAFPPARFAVLVNPGSGPARSPGAVEVREALRKAGLDAEVSDLADGEDVPAKAARFAAEGRAVVAAGGDGTINAVASALVGTGAPFGVLPLGTLNHFAKDAGIPPELDAAVALLTTGRFHDVDVGEVNGRIFLNNSGLGLYPSLVLHRDRYRLLRKVRWAGTAWAAFTALRLHPTVRVSVDAEGKRLTRTTALLFVGNNRYEVEGFEAGTRRSLEGGSLTAYVTSHVGRTGLLRLALAALLGKVRGADGFHELVAREITVETHRSVVHVALDGEVVDLHSPLVYRIRPGALRLIGPA